MEELTAEEQGKLDLVRELVEAMNANGNKIPYTFIEKQVNEGAVIHKQLTSNMRVCIIRTKAGHEVIGVAQVLDAANDDATIGSDVAYKNAENELWEVFGSIAKIL